MISIRVRSRLAAAAQLPINPLASLDIAAPAVKQETTLQRSRAVMLACKEESCLAGTAVAAVLAKSRLELRRR